MKIPNHKSQIPNNTQIPISQTGFPHLQMFSFGNLDIGTCLEFVIWNLEFKTPEGVR
ncbi:MAG TPA: hypothetical protein VK674_06515 [Candidatus Limnocylindria bacterium]|nr:hypothetical protein [Candidatus Limnocylindria bacterium]